MKNYIKNLDIPRYHHISYDGRYLRFSYENYYLAGDTVFSGFDIVNVIDVLKYKLSNDSIISMIDRFILNALERNKTKPYAMKILQDIDNIDYNNIWDFNYSDCGKKDRYLNGEGRCNY